MNKTVTRGQVSRLDLVYPPISNQEAVWLERIPEVQEELRASDFYMIAARREAKFTDIEIDEETHTARFNVRIWITYASLRCYGSRRSRVSRVTTTIGW